ncbi:MAG: hypothetical protein O7J95_20375 [Planctomycetota bacterium]|nr:hypothetical protein [Planctomycetota bacterium]
MVSRVASPLLPVLGLLVSGALALRAGEEEYYRLLTLPLERGLVLEPGGLAVLDDGRLAVAIRRGEVWLVENAYSDPPVGLRYRRFASGLHEPLGLLAKDGALYTVQRGELTRLRDLDGDGEADEYLTVAKGWGVTGNYHEYAYGPKLDGRGQLWITLNSTFGRTLTGRGEWRGWAGVVAPGGKFTPLSAGLRSPSGIGINAEGDAFYTDQQGEWIPAGTLSHMERGDFFGHVASLKSAGLEGSPLDLRGKLPAGKTVVEVSRQVPAYKLPAVWFPYRKMGQSATDVVCDRSGGRFGPFENQLLVGEFTLSGISRVFLEKVKGTYQGACFPFRSGFQCGVFRLAQGNDGSIFVGETNRGWNSLGPRSYGLQRLVWTGRVPFEVQEMRARRDGFALRFTLPVDSGTASSPASYRLFSYTYKYHGTYGSPEVDAKELAVRRAEPSPDGRWVRLRVEGLREGYVHELHLEGVRSRTGGALLHDRAYYTLNRIP